MRRPFIFTSLGVVRGESKRGNRKCGPENTHDHRADKYPYPHDHRADKDSYSHDRNVTDNLCSLIKLCFAFIVVNFST